MPQPALIGGPGVEAPRRLAHRALLLGVGDRRGDGDRYRFGDLVLDREDVGEIAVVALGPDVDAGLGLEELCGDTDPLAGLAQISSGTAPISCDRTFAPTPKEKFGRA
jgi:hypothetical protein